MYADDEHDDGTRWDRTWTAPIPNPTRSRTLRAVEKQLTAEKQPIAEKMCVCPAYWEFVQLPLQSGARWTEPGPCITNVFATRRKNFSQWHRSFQRKLRSHWLKFLRHVAKTLVIQGPGLTCLVKWRPYGNRGASLQFVQKGHHLNSRSSEWRKFWNIHSGYSRTGGPDVRMPQTFGECADISGWNIIEG